MGNSFGWWLAGVREHGNRPPTVFEFCEPFAYDKNKALRLYPVGRSLTPTHANNVHNWSEFGRTKHEHRPEVAGRRILRKADPSAVASPANV